jgi:excisionase family DNA binding protein
VSERYITANDVAELLGLTPRTILQWRKTRGLPGFKLGVDGPVRFRESEVLAWVESQREGDGGSRSANHDVPVALVSYETRTTTTQKGVEDAS